MNPFPDIPAAVLSPVLALISAIVRLVKAGDDAKAQEEALMQAAEDIKAERDRLKFGG